MKIFSLKLINSILLILILTCESNDPVLEGQRDIQRIKSERELMGIMLGTNSGIMEGCQEDEIMTAVIDHNKEAYLADKSKKYTSAIVGDSSMMYSETVLRFFNPLETKSIALFGNTLCGMIIQIQKSYISSENDPQYILTASMGGNDLLRGSDPFSVGNRGILLIDAMVKSFPEAKLTFVLVHPNLVHYVNYSKNISNAIIVEYVSHLNNSNVCIIDPTSEIFHIGPKEDPTSDMMRDAVHYSSEVSMKIKLLAVSKCGMIF